MQIVTVRTAEEKDAQTYQEWLNAASDINLVDYRVYQYPCLITVVAEKGGMPILMNSAGPVLMVEALAPRPGLSAIDEARALKALFDEWKAVARATGIKEIWFGCRDPRVEKFAQRHDFEKVNFSMFRIRL